MQVKVIPLDVSARLNELRALPPGWLEGGGAPPPGEGLDRLAAAFQTHFPDELPSPYLYPTETGGIQAEWQIGAVDVSLEIDLRAHAAHWHTLSMQTNQADSHDLDLNAEESWRWLASAIRRLAGGAA
ncbi:MAG TPA: hypothetical protein VN541_23385 [Tepidisphaeraceae bacterium]|nr:hypothetical protein [Tepidisphaeraceae bacterium]